LSRAHAALGKDLKKLEEAAGALSAQAAGAWNQQLEAARECLAEHFRIEEHNGYMDAVLERAPHLERPVQHLLEEHQQLMQALNALIATAGRLSKLDDTFRQQVREWVKAVRGHESRENNLVEDAFKVDTGAED
jgi:hypothetical protein